MTGERAHTARSFIINCHGDEAGTGLGIQSGTQMGSCEPKTWSQSVRVEGKPAVRHGDEWHMNNRNTVGKLNWVEDTQVYAPTPPFTEEPPARATAVVADVGPLPGYGGAAAAVNAAISQIFRAARSRFMPYNGFTALLALEEIEVATRPLRQKADEKKSSPASCLTPYAAARSKSSAMKWIPAFLLPTPQMRTAFLPI